MVHELDIVIVGAGASGMFCAIQIGQQNPNRRVLILESQPRPLQKVRISGGGRCNVTHHHDDPEWIASHYPRGRRFMRKVLYEFSPRDMRSWLSDHGVCTYAQEDGRVFPMSNESGTIVDCFLEQVRLLPNVTLRTQYRVSSIVPTSDGFVIDREYRCRQLVIATGGLKRADLLAPFDLVLSPRVPSLFAFDIRDGGLNALAGIGLEAVQIKLPKKKWTDPRGLLITHRGLSGPAVLIASALYSYELYACDYRFSITVRWHASLSPTSVAQWMDDTVARHPNKQLKSVSPEHIPAKLWRYLLRRAQLNPEMVWKSLNGKQRQAVVECLTACQLHVDGKTTNKDEFVTAGGVALNNIRHDTMEVKHIPGLYILGEALDIDGLTGGFNFQAAWSTAWVAAKGISAN